MLNMLDDQEDVVCPLIGLSEADVVDDRGAVGDDRSARGAVGHQADRLRGDDRRRARAGAHGEDGGVKLPLAFVVTRLIVLIAPALLPTGITQSNKRTPGVLGLSGAAGIARVAGEGLGTDVDGVGDYKDILELVRGVIDGPDSWGPPGQKRCRLAIEYFA